TTRHSGLSALGQMVGATIVALYFCGLSSTANSADECGLELGGATINGAGLQRADIHAADRRLCRGDSRWGHAQCAKSHSQQAWNQGLSAGQLAAECY